MSITSDRPAAVTAPAVSGSGLLDAEWFDAPGGYTGVERLRSGRTRSDASRAPATRPCSRTTISFPPSRMSPTTSVTLSPCRVSRPRSTPTRSSSAASTSWRRPQDPQPRETRPHPGRARRLLAGRLDHRRRTARLEGRVPPRCGRGVLREHHRRGEGSDRHLLHLVERRRRRRVDRPRSRRPVPSGPVPRCARQA